MKKDSLLFNYLMVILVMLIWGLNVVILKVLVDELPPLPMTAVRVTIASITAYLFIRMTQSFRRATKNEFLLIVLSAVCGVILHHLLLAVGLQTINASSAALILALVPITTALFATLFLKEAVTRLKFLGFVLAFAGVFFIQGASFTSFNMSTGELVVFISMVAQALGFIFTRKVTVTMDSRQVTAWSMLIGSFGLLILSFVLDFEGVKEITAPHSMYIYVLLIMSAVGATALGYIIYNASIQKVGASNTVVFNNLVPLFGLIFSSIFLNEIITTEQITGFIFIVAGILFGTGYFEYIFSKYRKNKK
ncbi:DMT family transporter [Corticicoccus populi]|uniref:DMT family transporter n=1 Tax=Corticicoccus populi TaxID=1812821 RepID=A0ABW5WUJ9_9STAP